MASYGEDKPFLYAKKMKERSTPNYETAEKRNSFGAVFSETFRYRKKSKNKPIYVIFAYGENDIAFSVNSE